MSAALVAVADRPSMGAKPGNPLLVCLRLRCDRKGRTLPMVTPFDAYEAAGRGAALDGAIIAAENSEALVLAGATEDLLVTGGDTRLAVVPASGLNAYGCSPRPRPRAITFASSTASSISEHAYMAADRLRRTLAAAASTGRLGRQFAAETQAVRADIRRMTGADRVEGSEIVLAASGTDCELLATWIARADAAVPVVNIVVGESETGSGIVKAAAGCHFAARTALGATVQPAHAIAGMAGTGLAVETIALRDRHGQVLAAADIDRCVERIVARASAAGAQVLLHVLDVSKTGLFAPRLETVVRLAQRHGKGLAVIVDACQFRTSPETIARYLGAGWLVQITGSKFFTGPPFAGALLVPPAMAAAARCRAAPEGLIDYATQDDFPCGWHDSVASLPRKLNYGLLLRWRAALMEMERFHRVPPQDRYRTLARFGKAIEAAIAASRSCDLLAVPPLDRAPFARKIGYESLRTIFAFKLRSPADARQALDLESLQRVYQLVNLDIAHRLPPDCSGAERMLAAQECHIGQPVPLYRDASGRVVAALRISAGARLVSGVAFDPALGPDPAERLEREISDACLALKKIELILHYWGRLEAP
jgi:hypothetical protein